VLTIACVDHKNYEKRGVEYVQNLHRACAKHITLPFEFVCFSDRQDYGEGVRVVPVSGQAWGWYCKLEMLGSKALRGRCLYFDLDSLILRNIDDLAAYQGPFAGLGCARSNRLFSSGIMAWEAGSVDYIWEKWLKAGKPILGSGDDEWIDKVNPHAHRLQHKFAGIYSFKWHKCSPCPPDDARIIFFTRQPKCHNASMWVQKAWNGEENWQSFCTGKHIQRKMAG
jgi:hypothetical protein